MAKQKFLVVDDSLLIREFIKSNIAAVFPDIEVSDAGNGKEARQKLENSHFDLILCDWEMPEMNGSELLQWIRGNPATGKLPFIMVTAKRERESILEAIKLGVTDYIVKPLTADVLCRKITIVLRRIGRAGA